MNAKTVLENVKVLNVVPKSSEDGSINWHELVFMQGSDINTVTVDNKVAEQLEVDTNYHLVLQITEVLKAFRNGSGAYKNHKFKIVGFYDVED